MREIKFRAFWKSEKVMTEVEDIDFLNEKIVCSASEWAFIDMEDLILMQYIGIRDKREKRIYEGDIILVKSGDPSVSYSVEATVIFKDGTFGMKTSGKLESEKDAYLDFHTFTEIWSPTSIEVLGNIYENPELLEKQACIKE